MDRYAELYETLENGNISEYRKVIWGYSKGERGEFLEWVRRNVGLEKAYQLAYGFICGE